MSHEVTITLICDFCGSRFEEPFRGQYGWSVMLSTARYKAKQKGWLRVHRKEGKLRRMVDVCRECPKISK